MNHSSVLYLVLFILLQMSAMEVFIVNAKAPMQNQMGTYCSRKSVSRIVSVWLSLVRGIN